MHTCTKCKNPKQPNEMSKDKTRHNGLSSWCKDCRKVSVKSWTKRNPEHASRLKDLSALRKAELRASSPEEAYMKRRAEILKCRYGLSLADYDAMLVEQHGCCAICDRPADDLTYLLHVDHCHSKYDVRGLLCSSCNQFLGVIKDSVDALYRAIAYLQRPTHKNKTEEERIARKNHKS